MPACPAAAENDPGTLRVPRGRRRDQERMLRLGCFPGSGREAPPAGRPAFSLDSRRGDRLRPGQRAAPRPRLPAPPMKTYHSRAVELAVEPGVRERPRRRCRAAAWLQAEAIGRPRWRHRHGQPSLGSHLPLRGLPPRRSRSRPAYGHDRTGPGERARHLADETCRAEQPRSRGTQLAAGRLPRTKPFMFRAVCKTYFKMACRL